MSFSLTVSYFSMRVQDTLELNIRLQKIQKNILALDEGNQDTIRGSDQL